MPDNNPTPTGSYIRVIKLHDDPTPLLFGPFPHYAAADTFIQQKALEYKNLKTAYVEELYHPTLYPGRSV